MMPKSFENFPIFFTDKDKASLKGTGMVEMIYEETRMIQEDFDMICEEVADKQKASYFKSLVSEFSLREFAHAMMIIKSKAIKMRIKGKETLGLVPMQDLFDQSPDSVSVEQGFDDEMHHGGFVVKASKDMCFAQKIFQPVKQQDHQRYFLEQGRLMNTNRREVPLTVELDLSDQKFVKMSQFLDSLVAFNQSQS